MRVAILSGNAPRQNAIGNQIAEMVRFFHERGAELRVYVQNARRLHPDLQACTAEVQEAVAKGPAWEFLRRADLIIAVYAQSFDLLQYLPRLAGTGPHIVFAYYGVTPRALCQGTAIENLEKSARQRGYVWFADLALATSDDNARELIQATRFRHDAVTTLPLPVNLDRFRAWPNEPYLREKLGLEGPILLFVGRLAGNKRVPLLIEGLSHLTDTDAHAVIVGDTSDVYVEEAARCRDLAERWNVADRVHWLGRLDDELLPRVYQGADVFVMPSVHEGFCVPVIEAMACGLPVVASRSAALPETVGDAGLTFSPGDVNDLVRQLRRVLTKTASMAPRRRVAIVVFRFGPDIVGGAETSLRTMAKALQAAGQQVEVFTTCTASESHWRNDLPAGDLELDGLLVHRFPIDPHDSAAHGEVVREILDADGSVDLATAQRYLHHSIHSTQLLETLRQRRVEFDAIIIGPYLFGLTADIATEFRAQTLIVPCIHNEALARLPIWSSLFGSVGGILYHTPEEQTLAQTRLGINHPNSHQVGTVLSCGEFPHVDSNPIRSRPYIVYCGRYSAQKNLPLLVEWTRRFGAEHGGVDVVFMGRGDVPLPCEPWLHDLGHVSEAEKRDVLAKAVALVQLSTQESLSLVVLEAWAEGTPVIVHRECAVLAGQVERANGGLMVYDYESFTAAIDALVRDEGAARAMGQRGREYVLQNYVTPAAYTATLLTAIDNLGRPLAELMRERGIARAAEFARQVWQRRFAKFVDRVLTSPRRELRSEVVLEPLRPILEATAGTRTLLFPVRLLQRGSVAASPDGPGALGICVSVRLGNEEPTHARLRLPDLLTPGKPLVAALPISLPEAAGSYRLVLWSEDSEGQAGPVVEVPLMLTDQKMKESASGSVFLETVQDTLAKAQPLERLPTDYVDVTEGSLAPVKRFVKRKLLNNFKNAYVDVLSRQQTQLNSHLVLMIQQLSECCALLDHAVTGVHERIDGLEAKLEQLAACEDAGRLTGA